MDHESGCPRLQFWDASECDAQCLCNEEETMDVHCDNCHEPWDVYHIVHDEGLLEFLTMSKILTPTEQDTIHFKEYTIVNLCGYNEIPEGHFLIQECPSCKGIN